MYQRFCSSSSGTELWTSGELDAHYSYLVIQSVIFHYLLCSLRSKNFCSLAGLCFLLALLDCTSRILFLPFIAQFHPTYIKSYFIGETLTGLLPSIFSLFQGIGTDGSTECISILANSNLTQRYEVKHLPPNIPVSMFMVFILSIMLLCSVSFALLNVKSIVKHARNATTSPPLNIVTSTDHEMTQEMKHSNSSTLLPNIQPRFVNFWSLLTLQCVNCLIYGSTDAILSYSTLPYGSVTFLLAVTLRYSASSLMCLINLFLPQPKSKIMLSVIGLFLSSVMYCFWTAATSPNPPLEGKLIGSVLIVCTAVTAAVTFTYIKVITALWLQSVGGYRGIFSFGIATQIGYGTAAVVMFLLVNTWELFVSKPDCPVKP